MIPIVQKPVIDFDFDKRIFIKENVLPNEVCDEIVQWGKDNVKTGINKYPHLFQISFKACLLPLDHYVHKLLQPVWEEASEYIKTPIEFVEPYEIKQYTSTNFFSKHTDQYNSLSKDIDRKITISVQLSNDYTGGDLITLNKICSKTKGSITAFPTNFPHEVRRVLQGERWSLIGWAWGPQWK